MIDPSACVGAIDDVRRTSEYSQRKGESVVFSKVDRKPTLGQSLMQKESSQLALDSPKSLVSDDA